MSPGCLLLGAAGVLGTLQNVQCAPHKLAVAAGLAAVLPRPCRGRSELGVPLNVHISGLLLDSHKPQLSMRKCTCVHVYVTLLHVCPMVCVT